MSALQRWWPKLAYLTGEENDVSFFLINWVIRLWAMPMLSLSSYPLNTDTSTVANKEITQGLGTTPADDFVLLMSPSGI
jgi:hypothetical protein